MNWKRLIGEQGAKRALHKLFRRPTKDYDQVEELKGTKGLHIHVPRHERHPPIRNVTDGAYGMTASNVVDVNDPKANMYGCQPCPKCGSEYRVPTKSGWIECDDCGNRERPVVKER